MSPAEDGNFIVWVSLWSSCSAFFWSDEQFGSSLWSICSTHFWSDEWGHREGTYAVMDHWWHAQSIYFAGDTCWNILKIDKVIIVNKYDSHFPFTCLRESITSLMQENWNSAASAEQGKCLEINLGPLNKPFIIMPKSVFAITSGWSAVFPNITSPLYESEALTYISSMMSMQVLVLSSCSSVTFLKRTRVFLAFLVIYVSVDTEGNWM